MVTTKSISRVLSVLLSLMVLLTVNLPARAESLTGPRNASGSFSRAKRTSGSNDHPGTSIAVDSSGNVYTTGYFEGTVDFNPRAGTFNLTSAGGSDIFISKVDSSGNFVWAKKMGGTSYDESYGITLDSSGNVLTTGYFEGPADFDPGTGTSNLTGYGTFVSKLTSSGSFVWAEKIGGTGRSIIVDLSGNVYTTGSFVETADFDPGPGVFNMTSAGLAADIFISKLDSSGNFVWAKRIGGVEYDYGYGIALDINNNVYTTGSFLSTVDFDPGAGTFTLICAGGSNLFGDDIFVSKLDSDGNFVWAKRMGGPEYDRAYGIALDSNKNVYTTGFFNGTVNFDPGAGTSYLTSAGYGDIFVSKLDSNGNFVWAKNMGGTSDDIAYAIALDSSGSAFTTGAFNGIADFDPGVGTFNLTSAGPVDTFVSKLDSSGNFVWAKHMGGTTSSTQGLGIAAGSSGIHTTGFFNDTADFDPGTGTANLISAGGSSTFVSKLDSNGSFSWAKSMGIALKYLFLPLILR